MSLDSECPRSFLQQPPLPPALEGSTAAAHAPGHVPASAASLPTTLPGREHRRLRNSEGSG